MKDDPMDAQSAANIVLQARCLDASPWQVRRYMPDPAKVMVLSPSGRWVLDAAELIRAIQAVSEPAA